MLDFNKIQCEFLDSDVAVCLIFFRILTVISGTFPIKGKRRCQHLDVRLNDLTR